MNKSEAYNVRRLLWGLGYGTETAPGDPLKAARQLAASARMAGVATPTPDSWSPPLVAAAVAQREKELGWPENYPAEWVNR